MYGYASDPDWAANIVRIADQMRLPNLAGLGVAIARPAIPGPLAVGRSIALTLASKAGAAALPPGLHAAYRFVPVDENGAPVVGSAQPAFSLGDGVSEGGLLRLRINAPSAAGAYRVEFELRDSDGTPLTEPRLPGVPSVATFVHDLRAVSLRLVQ